jgi:uncharacterized protein YjbJ (UPF0337 family)
MDKKNVEGTVDTAKGQVKETVGSATGNRQTQAEGKLDQLKGKLENAAGKLREGIKHEIDDLKHKGNKPQP